MDFQEVIRCFQEFNASGKASLSAEKVALKEPLYGRVTSLHDPTAELTQLANSKRKTVFAFGPDMIRALLTLPYYEFLLRLGFTHADLVEDIVHLKWPQRLVLCKKSETFQFAEQATWDGIMKLVTQVYPDAVVDLQKHWDEVKSTPLAEFEKKAGFTFATQARRVQEPQFMSYTRFKTLPQPREAWQVRAFLYSEVKLLDLFRGDGKIVDWEGKETGTEYILPNAPLSQLGEDAAVLEPIVHVPVAHMPAERKEREALAVSASSRVAFTVPGEEEEKEVCSAFEVTLCNGKGAVAKFLSVGATLTQLHIPDKNGIVADVVLGHLDPKVYLGNPGHLGATAGRFANRIGNAAFMLEGKRHQLLANNGTNTLHGGPRGWAMRNWAHKLEATAEASSVEFSYASPHGEQGFPGTVHATVRYTLTAKNELEVVMRAELDEGSVSTVVNMAHHTYWNLRGHQSGSTLGHELTLHADQWTPTDPGKMLPNGRVEAVPPSLDFRKPRVLGEVLEKFPHLKEDEARGGFMDHNFVVRGWEPKLKQLVAVAKLHDPVSGRTMEVFADQPGVQCYTANWLGVGEKCAGKGGVCYEKFGGVCVETQAFPDSPNRPEFPSTVLSAAVPYVHRMVHRFTAE